MILYYCRFATRPVLLQLYQTEVGRGAQQGKGGPLPVPPTWGPSGRWVWVWQSCCVLVGLSLVSLYSPGDLHMQAHSALADALAKGSGVCRSWPNRSQLTRAVFLPSTFLPYTREIPVSAGRSITLLEISLVFYFPSQTPAHNPFSITCCARRFSCSGEGLNAFLCSWL